MDCGGVANVIGGADNRQAPIGWRRLNGPARWTKMGYDLELQHARGEVKPPFKQKQRWAIRLSQTSS